MSTPDRVFEALADPTRRVILELLHRTPDLRAGEVAAAFPTISRPAVSRHLRVLREAGLVTSTKEGREWRYAIDPAPLAEVTQTWFAQFAPLWEEALTRLKARAEEAG